MELFDTDLWSFIKTKTNRDDIPLMIDISLQVISGLAHLHSQKPPMIHRDIKPPNVLIKRHPKTNAVIAKLSDFGISSIIESREVFENPTMSNIRNTYRSMITTVGGRGTILFLAAEFFAAKDGRGLVDGRFRIDSSVDIFALGLVYLYMICYNTSDYGKSVSQKQNYSSIMKNNLRQLIYFLQDLPLELLEETKCPYGI